ncbi:MAG: 4Fe-4S binding protein [Theionarchaea archaeon]|nr:4Fe-4S binding protein [Theionarchaea archaeon]MBU7000330.1 4Fe-4S binding protein [Theionarchaea archaeon]MBU7022432.1 4Fe-4S binding protein [Theionarchaea archaeon]MBU7035980.1 4Fe-4S binding protein [Theionarchaea archaeon]
MSQILFLVLFVILFYYTHYPLDFVHTNLFVRTSPLLLIINSLSTRTILIGLIPAVFLLLSTVVLGRFFCGWICPVGTVSDLLPKTKKRLSSFYRFKYYFLVFSVVLAVFGFQILVVSDPLVIFTRSLTFITQKTVPVMLILIVILVLALGERFWCRIVCPLGALLGAASRFKPIGIRAGESCTECGLCGRVCPMNAIQDCRVKNTECTLCMLCVDRCPRGALAFTVGRTQGEVGFESRRTFLKAGVAAGAALALSPLLTGRRVTSAGSTVIRPPGALKEEDFLSVCVRCGECMRVCPSQGLRPVLFEGSLSDFYTPHLVPRIGECQLCMLCWQVCPTGALVEVDPAEMKLGTATVNRNTCLEWRNEPCLVCQEVCPYQAVDVIESGGRGRSDGGRRGPTVNRSLCAGCGACERHCPTEPTSISVSPEGEKRY